MSNSAALLSDQDYALIVLNHSEFVYMITPLVSLASSLVILVICLAIKVYKEALGVMVISINAANFIHGLAKIANLLYKPSDDTDCRILLFFSHFGMCSSLLWGAAFSHALYQVITYKKIETISNNLKYYAMITTLFPFIQCILILLTDFVEYNDSECIHKGYYNKIDPLYVFYIDVPILTVCVLSVMWYSALIKQLKQFIQERNSTLLLTLFVYPGIVLICWTPVLITQLLVSFGIRINLYVLNAFGTFSLLQGFFDALAYVQCSKTTLVASWRRFRNRSSRQISWQSKDSWGTYENYDFHASLIVEERSPKSENYTERLLQGESKGINS